MLLLVRAGQVPAGSGTKCRFLPCPPCPLYGQGSAGRVHKLGFSKRGAPGPPRGVHVPERSEEYADSTPHVRRTLNMARANTPEEISKILVPTENCCPSRMTSKYINLVFLSIILLSMFRVFLRVLGI